MLRKMQFKYNYDLKIKFAWQLGIIFEVTFKQSIYSLSNLRKRAGQFITKSLNAALVRLNTWLIQWQQ